MYYPLAFFACVCYSQNQKCEGNVMRRLEQYKNFIIYLFLAILLIAGAGYGLDEERQVFSAFKDSQESRIFVPTISANSDIHTFQVRERTSVSLRHNYVRSNYLEASLKGNLAFLCVLAILLVLFRLIQEIFVHFRRLYVRERFMTIFFIQDQDGRKRFL